MKFFGKQQLSWLPQLHTQVWILIVGRLLSQIGSGFTLFYAPIFFVNQVGLSATQVGFALGSASISGLIGRILSGAMSDSRAWGRKPTLLLSAAISAIASVVMAQASNFSILVVGNLLMGFGIGLYWPATEAVVADLTEGQNRKEAYALTRLGDNIGLGVGIILGGILIGTTGAYRALFVVDAISFMVFFGVIYANISETYKHKKANKQPLHNWKIALSDRTLLVYVLVNVIFTSYIAQMESTIPLYFSNFVPVEASGKGFSPIIISAIFALHLILAIVLQIPIIRFLKHRSHTQSLSFSAILWAIGFCLIWVTGVAGSLQLIWAILGMSVFAIATVAYTPSASALVADIAPESLRGIYLSINSLCWAAGYAVGPPLGGWALDQPPFVVHSFWLGLAASVAVVMVILQYLDRMLHLRRKKC